MSDPNRYSFVVVEGGGGRGESGAADSALLSTPSEERDARVCVRKGAAVRRRWENLMYHMTGWGPRRAVVGGCGPGAVSNDPDVDGGGGEEESL